MSAFHAFLASLPSLLTSSQIQMPYADREQESLVAIIVSYCLEVRIMTIAIFSLDGFLENPAYIILDFFLCSFLYFHRIRQDSCKFLCLHCRIIRCVEISLQVLLSPLFSRCSAGLENVLTIICANVDNMSLQWNDRVSVLITKQWLLQPTP